MTTIKICLSFLVIFRMLSGLAAAEQESGCGDAVRISAANAVNRYMAYVSGKAELSEFNDAVAEALVEAGDCNTLPLPDEQAIKKEPLAIVEWLVLNAHGITPDNNLTLENAVKVYQSARRDIVPVRMAEPSAPASSVKRRRATYGGD